MKTKWILITDHVLSNMARSEKAQYVVQGWGWVVTDELFCVCVLREGALFLVKLQGALAINPGHQIRP